MNIPNQCIIIGGGVSVKEGLSLGLKDRIKDKFVILCNYAVYHFSGTILTFIDSMINDGDILRYYKGSTENSHFFMENISTVKKYPLCVALDTGNIIPEYKWSNILFLKGRSGNQDNNFKDGVYSGSLSGIFSLSVAVNLLPENSTIFLCGYDFSRRLPEQIKEDPDCTKIKSDIHFYNDIKHRGTGWSKFYEEQDPKQWFDFFNRYSHKIYNVSPQSNITTFEKIDYNKMFELLDTNVYNQEELRNWIKSTIKEKS